MVVLYETHEAYLAHDPGPRHPERPDRLRAARSGAGEDGVDAVTPRPATREELALVHDEDFLDALEQVCRTGPAAIDIDTRVGGPASWDAALLAAGAGVDAVDRLRRGEGAAAFCAVRPPGHHASSARAMGFCLLNSIAVTAAVLASSGERVAIVDYDAHHGNGTQALFWRDPRVLYVSLHGYGPGVYPGTGRADEVGAGDGVGTTVNVPLRPGAAIDAYRDAFDAVVAPAVFRFEPGWLLLSAGFDAHRDDPITDMGLVEDDFAELTNRCLTAAGAAASAGHVVAFLEGGYDLTALAGSVGATIRALSAVL